MTTIPDILKELVLEGKVVLFLGAGASVEAVHEHGQEIPTANELAIKISNKFLGGAFNDSTLAYVAELAISETSLHEVQEFVKNIFIDFYPSNFHLLIPEFRWKSIVTTNFDLIIERSYSLSKDALQQPIVFKKDGEWVDERMKKHNSLMLIKLHGCILDIADVDAPLILTTDQYITHRNNRKRLFEKFEDLARNNTCIFVGHSLQDYDLRSILLEVEKLQTARPRSYLVLPTIKEPEERYWSSKRFTCIKSTFKNFIEDLHATTDKNLRKLSFKKISEGHPILNILKIKMLQDLSERLQEIISNDMLYVHKGIETQEVIPQNFYKGYFSDLSPIIYDLDVKRNISDNILSEVFLESEVNRRELQEFFLIYGHAGSGKSVILSRLAWDATVDYNKICIFLKNMPCEPYDAITELCNLANDRVYIFVDPVSEYAEFIEKMYIRAKKENLKLTIIGAERTNEWNIYCRSLEALTTHRYEIRYLSELEIDTLLELLAKHNSLGYLKKLSFQEQRSELRERAGRVLLVALHEATLGKPFSDIIYDEYNQIVPNEARDLYLTVCILHRLGVLTRAGLISRIHNISFHEFKDKLFDPLEHIIYTKYNELIGDYVYRSRHSHVAEMVFETVLTTQQSRFDEYIRLISAIDVDYSSDREAFKKITNARELLSLFTDPQMVRQIYEYANTRSKDDIMLMQQEAIFEMNHPGGSINKAELLLQSALSKHQDNRIIAHSLSELYLRKAQDAQTPLLKEKYQNEAISLAYKLASGPIKTEHPFHTILKIRISTLENAIATGNLEYIETEIKRAEESINAAKQLFPNNGYILTAESDYSQLINNHPAAIQSLEKAFSTNQRNPYIATRLSRYYKSCKRYSDAISVLKTSLDKNPADKLLNFQLAINLYEDAKSNMEEIKHHLRRSFTKGDSNYTAQYWYARHLYIENKIDEANSLFRELGSANIDLRVKKRPKNPIKDTTGIKIFRGEISRLESSYAFIIRDSFRDTIFTHEKFNSRSWNNLSMGQRVKFYIAFSFNGAFAICVSPDTIS